jgi:predicted DNA repair protein MutK
LSTGLIALLDDVAALAKVAAASLDDVAAQAGKAGTKALGVVIDDTAVTPRYMVGFAAARELPIVGRIAIGSLKNKILFLLPGSLALSYLTPWIITPLLMLGGAYLCYEGAEKVLHAVWPDKALTHEEKVGLAPQDPLALEEQRIRSAIKTDFILSAEVMALTLASLTATSTLAQAAILAVVGLGITFLVYGSVALIVKADDVGVALSVNDRPVSTLLGLRDVHRNTLPSGADRVLRLLTKNVGFGLVIGMPHFLRILSIVGTAAMLWVGGGIILHGLEEFGATGLAHLVHEAALHTAEVIPAFAAASEWIVTAALSGLGGLALGAATIPLVQFLVVPAARRARMLFRPRATRPASAGLHPSN